MNYIYLSPITKPSDTFLFVKKVQGKITSEILKQLAIEYDVTTEDFEWFNEPQDSAIKEMSEICVKDVFHYIDSGMFKNAEDTMLYFINAGIISKIEYEDLFGSSREHDDWLMSFLRRNPFN